MESSAFLRTRVARRILLLFLLCAVLPLVVLASLGYQRVAADLEEVNRDHLRDLTKSSGMMLLDRLGSLAALLETMASQFSSEHPLRVPAVESAAGTLGPRFLAVGIRGPQDQVENIVGQLPALPTLASDQETHVRAGGIALVQGSSDRGVELFLVRAIDGMPGSELWGQISRQSIYGTDPSTTVAPDGALSCLTTEQGEALSCQTPESLRYKVESNATFRWHRGTDGYLAGRWTLFLRRVYASPSWTLTLSISDRVVSTPLASLRRIFLLGLALALVGVFALAHIQIRRSMEPLDALESGTQRVAAGQFDEAVVVKSGDEFEVLAASFNRMSSDLGHQFRYRDALARVQEAALSATGSETVLAALMAEQRTLLPGSSLGIALASPEQPERWTMLWGRNAAVDQGPFEVLPGDEDLALLQREGTGLILRRGDPTPRWFGPGQDRTLREDVLILPLCWRGTLNGAMVVAGVEAAVQDAGASTGFRRAADEIALAISNTQLVGQLDELNWGALTALARAIDAVSPWTAGHSERVTLGAVEIGRRLGLPDDDIDLLHRGGLLHDVGKVGVPVAILDKPGRLTDEEMARIRQHPTIGARILAPIGAFRRALPLVLYHHELLDGSGYPKGLSGDEIPLLVRVMTVADVFDALVSERPYRDAWPVEKAIDYLKANAPLKFDPRCVEALVTSIESGWRQPQEAFRST